MNFLEKLDLIVTKNNSLVCVGLDSDLGRIPLHLQLSRQPILEFNKQIIDATADLVCAYKPNSAFYEAHGVEGISQLKATCDYLHKTYPEIPIIIDAKRADIGSTNDGYATYAFDYLGADAITLHPYLGKEALEPFLRQKNKGCIILCRTSNPGASELQDLQINGEPLYKIIARQVVTEWNTNGNCVLVVGATYPEELHEVRQIATDMTLLVPGVGTQGGTVDKIVPAGVNKQGRGIIVNSSRDIIFASSKEDFASQSRDRARKLRTEINNYRKTT